MTVMFTIVSAESTCLKDIASYEREVTQLKDENTQLKAKISELERICAPREYGYEVVKKASNWQDARKYCTDKGGDLIQRNPKVYTLQGRNELAESLNLPTELAAPDQTYHVTNQTYHVGITRDDNGVWRRASDGGGVHLEGWFPGYPKSDDTWDSLVWGFWDSEYKNAIHNYYGTRYRYFICEYTV